MTSSGGRTAPRLEGYGHYHETYEKVEGDWLIASSTLTRLHMDFIAAPDAPG